MEACVRQQPPRFLPQRRMALRSACQHYRQNQVLEIENLNTELGQLFEAEGYAIERAPGATPDSQVEYAINGVSPYWFFQVILDMEFEFDHYTKNPPHPGAAHQVWAKDGLELTIHQSRYERAGDVVFSANQEL